MSYLKKRVRIYSSSTFSFYSSPQGIGWWPCMLVRADLLTQSTDSNDDPFRKHPHRHTQKRWFTSYMGIAQPNQVTQKINLSTSYPAILPSPHRAGPMPVLSSFGFSTLPCSFLPGPLGVMILWPENTLPQIFARGPPSPLWSLL